MLPHKVYKDIEFQGYFIPKVIHPHGGREVLCVKVKINTFSLFFIAEYAGHH